MLRDGVRRARCYEEIVCSAFTFKQCKSMSTFIPGHDTYQMDMNHQQIKQRFPKHHKFISNLVHRDRQTDSFSIWRVNSEVYAKSSEVTNIHKCMSGMQILATEFRFSLRVRRNWGVFLSMYDCKMSQINSWTLTIQGKRSAAQDAVENRVFQIISNINWIVRKGIWELTPSCHHIYHYMIHALNMTEFFSQVTHKPQP